MYGRKYVTFLFLFSIYANNVYNSSSDLLFVSFLQDNENSSVAVFIKINDGMSTTRMIWCCIGYDADAMEFCLLTKCSKVIHAFSPIDQTCIMKTKAHNKYQHKIAFVIRAY